MSPDTPEQPPRPPWAPVSRPATEDDSAQQAGDAPDEPTRAAPEDSDAARPESPYAYTPPVSPPSPTAPSPQPPVDGPPEPTWLSSPAPARAPEAPPEPPRPQPSWQDEPAPSAPPVPPQFRPPTPPASEPAAYESPAAPEQAPPSPSVPREPQLSAEEPSAQRQPWRDLDEQLNPPTPQTASPPPAAAQWPTPEPVDIDTDDDIVSPVAPTAPEETFPASGSIRRSLFSSPVSPYDTYSDGQPQSEEFRQEPGADADPFRGLGQSAVNNASLSAGGAPTPMGGVPLYSEPPSTPPSFAEENQGGGLFADEAAPFAPRFESSVPQPQPEQPTERLAPVSDDVPTVPFAPVSGEQPVTPAGHANAPMLAPQTDHSLTPDGDSQAPPDGPDGSDTEGDDHHVPWWRSAIALTAYGLIAMGALGFGAYQLLLAPDPITLESPIILEGPPDNGVTPIQIEEPTQFLSSIPTGTLTHSLIEVDSFAPGELSELPARTVEAHDLTYSDAENTYVVRAIQHYNADDAIENYEALSADATDVAPVEAGGREVGERAILETEDGTVIVWRNETAVLTLSGPDTGLVDFFTFYDL